MFIRVESSTARANNPPRVIGDRPTLLTTFRTPAWIPAWRSATHVVSAFNSRMPAGMATRPRRPLRRLSNFGSLRVLAVFWFLNIYFGRTSGDRSCSDCFWHALCFHHFAFVYGQNVGHGRNKWDQLIAANKT